MNINRAGRDFQLDAILFITAPHWDGYLNAFFEIKESKVREQRALGGSKQTASRGIGRILFSRKPGGHRDAAPSIPCWGAHGQTGRLQNLRPTVVFLRWRVLRRYQSIDKIGTGSPKRRHSRGDQRLVWAKMMLIPSSASDPGVRTRCLPALLIIAPLMARFHSKMSVTSKFVHEINFTLANALFSGQETSYLRRRPCRR